MKRKPLVVYMVGAHSTGKTTLARWVRDHYGLPMISEVARGVLAEMEEQLDTLRSNLDVVDRYQTEVFARQVAAEAEMTGPFVSDRAFCNLAYAAHHATILGRLTNDPRFADYMESTKQGIVFFIRPHRELLQSDGVRERLDWEEVIRIDGMVKLLLEMYSIPYIPVASLSMQERVRLVQRTLSLAGVEQLSEPRVPGTEFGADVKLDAASEAAPAHAGNGGGNGGGNGAGLTARTRIGDVAGES